MEKSAKLFIADTMFSMSAYWVCSGTVVAGLTSFFDLPVSLSNFLTGLTGTLLILQLVGGIAYKQCKAPFKFLRFTNIAWRITLPFAFFSVLLPRELGSIVLCISLVITVGMLQFASPAQTEWIVNSVEGKVKSDFYSVREFCFIITFTILLCANGLLINYGQTSGKQAFSFIVCGIVLSIMLFISIIVLLQLPKPTLTDKTKNASIIEVFKDMLKNKSFLLVLSSNMMHSFAGMLGLGFTAIYQIRILQLPFWMVILWATAGNFSRTLFTPIMAKIAAKISWRRVNILCMSIILFTLVGWHFTTAENVTIMFPILSILGAIPFAGLGVGFFQLQVATSPSKNRSMYFSIVATLSGAASFLGSVVCSSIIAILEQYSGTTHLRYVFIGGIFLMCISIFMATLIKKDTA